jgi:lipopolysaccharide/colanic/teichoic acid biosynthesis glycosyltransferase
MSIVPGSNEIAELTVGPGTEGDPFETTSRRKSNYLVLKRFCDILIVLLVALPASLVVALAAIAILRTMGTPVFFIQDRVGLGGRVFKMLKLRTMTHDPPDHIGATLPTDRRITPLGRRLRDSHIDELPQLWNVVRGDMSLVGPRPEQPHLANLYRDVIPNYPLRHAVRPGLSGYAQVYVGYAATLAETRPKLEHDLYYIRHMGAILDLRILYRTIVILGTKEVSYQPSVAGSR